MAGHRRAGHRRVGHRRVGQALYIAVVSGEYRIPLKMHKCRAGQCSRLISASDVAPEM